MQRDGLTPLERWVGRELGENFQPSLLQAIVSALVEFETECHAEVSDFDRMQSSLVGYDIRLLRKVSEKLLNHEQVSITYGLGMALTQFFKRLFAQTTSIESNFPAFPFCSLEDPEKIIHVCPRGQQGLAGDIGHRGPIPETIHRPPKTKFRRFRWRSARPNDRWLVICNDISQAKEFMDAVYGSRHPNRECRNIGREVVPITLCSPDDNWPKGPTAEVFDVAFVLENSPLHARHDHVAVLSDNISPGWWDWLMAGRFAKWPEYGLPTDVDPGHDAVVLCHGDLARLRRFRWNT